MIQTIFVVLGLLHFLDGLFEKWNWWNLLGEKCIHAKHKLIFDLCFCRFCLLFHLSWIITILYGAFSSFSFDLVIVPFIVSGLTRLKEKK